MYTNSLFLFQRSLRLDDNLGLIEACKNSKNVYGVFCVDPRQADPKKNKYFSSTALGFMYESLLDLRDSMNDKLILLYGNVHDVLPKFVSNNKIECVYMNYDYSPFARKRAEEITEAVDCDVVEIDDYLLFSPENIRTKTGTAHRVFTNFWNAVHRKKVSRPKVLSSSYKSKLTGIRSYKNITKKAFNFLYKNSEIAPDYTPAGRPEALDRLKRTIVEQKKYSKCRDFLQYTTTQLSAYIKFGCISIREAWHGFGKVSGTSSVDLQKQLIWREFYYHYYIEYPKELEWQVRPKKVVPNNRAPDIVSACFEQLDSSGWLHNRGRMILAHWMLKYQKEYWKDCDLMYAKRLVDYDPFVNIGNWRWIEKQPSFKTMSMEVQAKKWDRECDGSNAGGYQDAWLATASEASSGEE